MSLLKNEKGFMLVEILVVIAIIAILFITLLPQIDRITERARQTGVKTDFRSFQLASETYLRETKGKDFTKAGYDRYLDIGMQTAKNNNGSSYHHDFGLISKEKDPWGMPYEVYIFPGNKSIVIISFGPNKKIDNIHSLNNDNFGLATYYVNGSVASCTVGFGTKEMVSNLLEEVTDTNWHCGFPLEGDFDYAIKE